MNEEEKNKRNEEALHHLKNLKPYDGWSIDKYTNIEGIQKVVLKRRNVPLTNNNNNKKGGGAVSGSGFDCIVYDSLKTKSIIGITSSIGDTNQHSFCRGVVLVNTDGEVVRNQTEVRVSLNKKGSTSASASASASTSTSRKDKELNELRKEKRRNLDKAKEARRGRGRGGTTTATAAPAPAPLLPDLNNLTEEQTSQLIKGALLIIGVLTILKIVAKLFSSALGIFVLPIVLYYAMSTLPSTQSFDTKKELKRVLRGHHLPENHPEKPNDDWFSSTVARVTASVATELATSLGYTKSFIHVFGICHIAKVHVPVSNQVFYWIGIFGSWRYVMKWNLEEGAA